MATISINMKQISKFKVYPDNIKTYENIVLNNGKFITIDARTYVYWLNEFNIFYTLKGKQNVCICSL